MRHSAALVAELFFMTQYVGQAALLLRSQLDWHIARKLTLTFF